MGRTVLLAAVLLAATTTTPAFAQGGEVALPDGSAPPRDDGSLHRGAYEVTEEGALIYGGDVEYRCEDLVVFGAPAEPGSGDVTVDGGVVEPLTREAVELCAKAGSPPEGAILSIPASQNVAGADGIETLPGTGGPPFAASLLGAATLASAVAVPAILGGSPVARRGGRRERPRRAAAGRAPRL